MISVALINMPFARLDLPSLALTQLKAVLEREFKDELKVEIFYLNHDFARAMFGFDTHEDIARYTNANRGFGDWLFRRAAFPTLADNSADYFKRFFPRKTPDSQHLQKLALDIVPRLGSQIEQSIDRHALDRFDIVGFTSMFSQNVPSIAMARHIKRRNPQAIVVIGGANCEAPMGPALARNVDCIDYVFSGPALKSFPQFVRLYADHALERASDIPGVFSASNASAVSGKRAIGDELDIDEIIELDYRPFVDFIQETWQERKVDLTLLFETSRGCWWGERAHCTFCGLNGMTMAYRAMQPEQALRIMSSMFQYPNAKNLMSVDNIMPKSYIQSVFPHLNAPDTVSIFYEVKADLSEDEMEILSKSRVNVLQPGIEALATSTLKLMRKGTTSFSNISFLKNCLTYHIHPIWNLLVGFPGEAGEVFEKYLADIPTLVHLPAPVGVFPIRFDRYSPYFKDASKYGLMLEPMPFYELVYPFSKAELESLAYYFADRNYAAEYVRHVARYLSPLQIAIDAWSRRWATGDVPELSMRCSGRKAVIVDSRFGPAETFTLSEAASRTLKVLAKRMSASELASELPDLDEPTLAGALKELTTRQLLFAERERFMSIVIDKTAADARLAREPGREITSMELSATV